ncbi:MAG: hypothetical protein JWN43_3581 [Gammaproteobacteria bacterium]|nr:hypothetical protein [Gammaproteobacteria bacterium]
MSGTKGMGDTKGTSEESIGRPKQWREGRYEQPGKPVDRSVIPPSHKDDAPGDTTSTAVTEDEYERPVRPPAP